MSYFTDVKQFHKKFGLPTDEDGPPRMLNADEYFFRLKFIQEELREYEDAIEKGDLAEALDALVDLTYVVLGTALFHRFPFEAAWKEVQDANLKKVKSHPDERNPKRNAKFDVKKPPGWEPPDIEAIIASVEEAWGEMT